MRYWTSEEDRRLRQLWKRGLSDLFIGERLGRTPAAVSEHRRALGLAAQNLDGGEVWTAKRIAELTALWNAGISVAKIAERLGVTRNAVSGKRLRLGLPKRSGPLFDAKRWKSGHRRAEPAMVDQPHRCVSMTCADSVDPEIGRPVGLMELTRQSCRWPVGEPGSVDFGYCGRKTA